MNSFLDLFSKCIPGFEHIIVSQYFPPVYNDQEKRPPISYLIGSKLPENAKEKGAVVTMTISAVRKDCEFNPQVKAGIHGIYDIPEVVLERWVFILTPDSRKDMMLSSEILMRTAGVIGRALKQYVFLTPVFSAIKKNVFATGDFTLRYKIMQGIVDVPIAVSTQTETPGKEYIVKEFSCNEGTFTICVDFSKMDITQEVLSKFLPSPAEASVERPIEEPKHERAKAPVRTQCCPHRLVDPLILRRVQQINDIPDLRVPKESRPRSNRIQVINATVPKNHEDKMSPDQFHALVKAEYVG